MGEPAVCGVCVTISDLSEPLVVDSKTFLLNPAKPPTLGHLSMTRQPRFQ